MHISQEYLSLRYQTDDLLINAKKYPDYPSREKKLSELLQGREKMEKDASQLEKLADKMSVARSNLDLFSKAYAYDDQEISNIFDKAPAGKKIATLAKHL